MFPDRKQIIEYYGEVLKTNDKQGVCCNPNFPKNQLPEEIAMHSLSILQPLSQCKIKPDDQILDIGCGAGADCFLAALYGGAESKVYGLDVVEDLIARAKQLKEKFKISNVSFTCTDAPPLPYKTGSFNLVMMNYSFHLFQDKLRILGEIERVLVKGGRVIIADNFTPKDGFPSPVVENWFMFAGGAISIENFKILAKTTNLSVLDFVQVPETETIGYMICQKAASNCND